MKPKRAFFISDAHLGHHGKNIEDLKKTRLRNFLNQLECKDALFILGDLFDFWYEYKSTIPRQYMDTICMLNECVNEGVQIHFVTGNHDFGLGSYFVDDLRIKTYKKPTIIEWEAHRLFIAHGDGIIRKDLAGRVLRILMRNPFSMSLFRMLHPDIGIPLALFFSKLSRDYKSTTNRETEYRSFAEKQFSLGIDYVILGHTHRPDEWRTGKNVYINTGDWIEHFTYAKLENGKLRLYHWLKNDDE